MRSFLAPTEDFIKIERTVLAEDAAAGTNVTLTLKNNSQCAENGFIVIGREGSEQAELEKINQAVVAGTDVRVAVLLFPHKAGEPVTLYRYDKRKFYGSLTQDGVYAELTSDGSPKVIQVDDPQGTPFEYTGVDGYQYFKATYYNSVTDDETEETDAEAALADESVRYASIWGIRKMAGFTENPYITDGRIEDKRTQAENEINSYIIDRYVLPLDEIPPMITYVTECLAAGYMHYEEYGPEGDAVKKLGEARGILKAIKEGRQRLIGADSTELERVTTGVVLKGYPDGSEEGGDARKFTKAQKF
jgi:phage gp36-like protein